VTHEEFTMTTYKVKQGETLWNIAQRTLPNMDTHKAVVQLFDLNWEPLARRFWLPGRGRAEDASRVRSLARTSRSIRAQIPRGVKSEGEPRGHLLDRRAARRWFSLPTKTVTTTGCRVTALALATTLRSPATRRRRRRRGRSLSPTFAIARRLSTSCSSGRSRSTSTIQSWKPYYQGGTRNLEPLAELVNAGQAYKIPEKLPSLDTNKKGEHKRV
jgi:hypothetical protein